MPPISNPDTSLCPLCGQTNGCAIAAGRAPESCWCMAQTIDPGALARVAPDLRGVACVCSVCGSPQKSLDALDAVDAVDAGDEVDAAGAAHCAVTRDPLGVLEVPSDPDPAARRPI